MEIQKCGEKSKTQVILSLITSLLIFGMVAVLKLRKIQNEKCVQKACSCVLRMTASLLRTDGEEFRTNLTLFFVIWVNFVLNKIDISVIYLYSQQNRVIIVLCRNCILN